MSELKTLQSVEKDLANFRRLVNTSKKEDLGFQNFLRYMVGYLKGTADVMEYLEARGLIQDYNDYLDEEYNKISEATNGHYDEEA